MKGDTFPLIGTKCRLRYLILQFYSGARHHAHYHRVSIRKVGAAVVAFGLSQLATQGLECWELWIVGGGESPPAGSPWLRWECALRGGYGTLILLSGV